MTFKPYHYEHVNDFIRYYATEMVRLDVIEVLDKGISNETDAKLFCDFIPSLLDRRLADEKSGKDVSVDIGSGIISDLHYEAGSFVCDAGFEPVWEAMLDAL